MLPASAPEFCPGFSPHHTLARVLTSSVWRRVTGPPVSDAHRNDESFAQDAPSAWRAHPIRSRSRARPYASSCPRPLRLDLRHGSPHLRLGPLGCPAHPSPPPLRARIFG